MSNIKRVNPATLKQWLSLDLAILIDVREVSEYDKEHIENAHNIPLFRISEAEYLISAQKKIVLQCKSGMRSLLACGEISEMHDNLELYNLEGGIISWKKDGFSVITNG